MNDVEVKEQLTLKFMDVVNELQRREPKLADKIEAHIQDIAQWYVTNKRDMTLKEFEQILESRPGGDL